MSGAFHDYRLMYDEPSSGAGRSGIDAWNAALPIGNGRMGAMVYGDTPVERLQLNEESIWAGPPLPEHLPGATAAIAEARELLFQNKVEEAERIVKERVLHPHTGPRSYQPFGELWLEDVNAQDVEATTVEGKGERSDYHRELDLDTAIAMVEYVRAGVTHRREMFVSATDQVLVLHWSVDKRQSLSCKLSLTRDGSARIEVIGTDALLLTGQAEHRGTHAGVRFAGCVKAVPQGGHVQADGESLIIRDADSLTVYVAIRTCLQLGRVEWCRACVRGAASKSISNGSRIV